MTEERERAITNMKKERKGNSLTICDTWVLRTSKMINRERRKEVKRKEKERSNCDQESQSTILKM